MLSNARFQKASARMNANPAAGVPVEIDSYFPAVSSSFTFPITAKASAT
jgi:hypothetical protein